MNLNKTIVAEPLVDLRSIYLVAANVLSVIGLMLNCFLLYLIFFKTTKRIADYRIILMQNCFVDILYNAVNDIVKGQTDYKNGAFFLIGNDSLKVLSYPYYVFALLAYIFTLCYCVCSIPVQFVYRYFFIVYDKKLSAWEYCGLLSLSTLGALSFTAFYGFVVWPEEGLQKLKTQVLKEDIFYFHGVPPFLVAEIQNWLLKACFGYGFVIIGLSYGVTITTCLKVWKKLKADEMYYSTETRRLQTQMTKTMILQAIVPLIFALGPVGIAMAAAFALINISGFGFIVNSICSWIPVVNPLVTIISVKAYRKTVVLYFRKCLVIGRQRASSVVPSTLLA